MLRNLLLPAANGFSMIVRPYGAITEISSYSRQSIDAETPPTTGNGPQEVNVGRSRTVSAIVIPALSAACSGILARCVKADEYDERAKKVTVANSDQQDSLTLFFAARNALRESRIEDAGFYFYAAEIRASADLRVYEPVGVGGNSPGVCLAAIRETLGVPINPVVMRDRRALSRIVARLSKWTPVFEPGYNPGWEYKSTLPELQRMTAVKAAKTPLAHLQALSELLQDDAYFAAFKTVQDYNLTDRTLVRPDPGGAPLQSGKSASVSEDEYKSAMAELERIENTRGIHAGLFSEEVKAAREEEERFKKSWDAKRTASRNRANLNHVHENKYQVFASKVTYESHDLAGADPTTFEVLPVVEYAKDARHVYVCGHVIPKADPKTFWPLGGLYARDASTFYCGNVKMNVDDVARFEVVRPSIELVEYWRDGDFLFETGMSYDSAGLSSENPPIMAVSSWARDGKSYFYGPVRVKGCDYATFEVVDGSAARDKNQEYTGTFPTAEWANRRHTILKIDGFPSQ
jgi:DKNYY family